MEMPTVVFASIVGCRALDLLIPLRPGGVDYGLHLTFDGTDRFGNNFLHLGIPVSFHFGHDLLHIGSHFFSVRFPFGFRLRLA
jgi:hypothetical protein